MAKIYVLGNKNTTVWANEIGELITVPTMTVNDSSDIHDFVCRILAAAATDCKVVIDLDAIDPALAFSIAMHIRLSISDIKQRVFVPLLFVSCLSLESFLTIGGCSQIFLSTKGVALCSPEEAQQAVDVITGLTNSDYKSAFLDKIQIRPDATIGRHSMANQWGADVLFRLVCKDMRQETEEIVQAKKKLYYKYVYLQTVGIDAALGVAESEGHRNIMVNASGKKVLLIDDEADRGWSEVLRRWLYGWNAFDVENRSIANYDGIRDDIRQKIETDYYDLYILDLRLLGNEEDDIYSADEFSGMKVLKKIKSINRGNQVIIMTASNKAWNMKALIDAGADGYYIKESPEQQLSKSFSETNFSSFKDNVQKALNNGYKTLSSTHIDGDLANELVSILRSSLRQVLTAKSKEDFAYSYLALYRTLETLCRYYITEDGEKGWLVNDIHELTKYAYKGKNIVPCERILPKETKYPSICDRLLDIYVELSNGADVHFASSDLRWAIARRHNFVHNLHKESGKSIEAKKCNEIYDKNGFQHLLYVITTIITPLL